MTQDAVQLPDYSIHHPTTTAANGASIFLLHGAFGAKEWPTHWGNQ